MLLLLYAVIFGEMLVIVSFLFKTPLRKLVIIALNRVKRGRGPIVVKAVAATLVVMFASALYSISKIRRRTLEAGTVNPTDQVLVAKHTLEASLLGFVLFLSLIIDRLHHYIRELRVLRKNVEAAKKQSRSFEDSKMGSAVEDKSLKEEIGALRSNVKKLESECELKGSMAKALEADVVALKNQSERFLMEYDRLLADIQNLRNRLEGIEQSSSHVDDKKSL